MPLTNNIIEQLTDWCAKDGDLADVRLQARSDFFGHDEPEPPNYMGDAGDTASRERRFLRWFAFGFTLPDGHHPAELAAEEALITGPSLASTIKSIQGSRYVTAIVTTVMSGRGVYLRLENEEFEINSRVLSQELSKDDVVCAHIIPSTRGRWLVAPGWLVWPTHFGPGIRAELKKFQLDPIEVERFLQQRTSGNDDKKKVVQPRDKTLEDAVARMTAAAQAEGRHKLVKTAEEWKALILPAMKSDNFMEQIKDIVMQAGPVSGGKELNKWFGLLMNIWNNTPQPDRGGKSAYELDKGERT